MNSGSRLKGSASGSSSAYPSSSSSLSWWANFWASACRSKPLDSNSAGVRTSPGDGLVRRLGLFELVLIGVGASIGAGIFVVTGTVARDAGPGRI